MTTTGGTTGSASWVAEVYDAYVTTMADVPFLLAEARAAQGPILELMAGTGRLSKHLAEVGQPLTCVDLSAPMLARLRSKLAARGLGATIVETDIRRLDLPERRYALAILPFQSFAELLAPADQSAALQRIAAHLRPGGRFVCTLHNPRLRRKSVDGRLRLLGDFPLPDRPGSFLLWSVEDEIGETQVVRATQLYEFYDVDGRLTEKRSLDARFRLVGREEFLRCATAAGFEIAALYGDYDRGALDEGTSPFLIFILERT